MVQDVTQQVGGCVMCIPASVWNAIITALLHMQSTVRSSTDSPVMVGAFCYCFKPLMAMPTPYLYKVIQYLVPALPSDRGHRNRGGHRGQGPP